MESLSDTKWDAVISGTGLQNSLLALALSRSGKQILHVDDNEYYGGAEAAFALQELDEWVEKARVESASSHFRNASLKKSDVPPESAAKLSFSRAYTLTLSPQIIYAKSNLLSILVSSKVYKQLEFQAVGNWWIYDADNEQPLKRLPNGREDIFQDKNIDNRAKRSLMKFLKFVIDYENHANIWEPHAESNLATFLSSQFQLPSHLVSIIAALTLSLDSAEETIVAWALPRIARHLTSIGVFGPGFGAVIPKWGGGAEISQVACRAGAVGGGVYMLGTGVQSFEPRSKDGGERPHIDLKLTNGESIRTRLLIGNDEAGEQALDTKAVSKVVAIVSSPLSTLFTSSIEGSPLSSVSVVAFPPKCFTLGGVTHAQPVYTMVHSSDTGECPAGQSIIYASTRYSNHSKALLDAAIDALIAATSNECRLLYKLYYEQTSKSSKISASDDASLDLAFNDDILFNVEKQWQSIMGDIDDGPRGDFMQFPERNDLGSSIDDEDNDVY